MTAGCFDELTHQYRNPDPLQVRIDTHRNYGERQIDLDRAAADVLGLGGSERLLDAGCGPGLFLKYLREQGHAGRLVGLDQSAGMIAAARTAAEKIEGVVGDVAALPFGDGEFDWAVGRHMLYHVPDIARALAELRRVAAQGVLVSTGSSASMSCLMTLLSDVICAFGMTPVQPVMNRFCTENAGAWFEASGLVHQETLIDNALVFVDAAPMVAYVLSCLPSYSINAGDDLYARMEQWLMECATEELDRASGTIRDPTMVGLYIVR